MELTSQAIDTLLATGRGQQAINLNPQGDPYFINPGGTATSLANFFPPRRVRQNVTLLDAGSFIDYVNRFKSADSLIFSNVTESNATFTAILDYHKMDLTADYCAHRASFTTQPTPEWSVWLKSNRVPMSQVDFATWLEDNLKLFVTSADEASPSAAELLELVRTLHGHQNARFSSNLRLQTGAFSASYDEDTEVKGTMTTKPGSIDLPAQICGGFPLFQGGEAYAVPARLKSRIVERKLMLHYETISLPQLVRENIMAVVKQVGEKTGIIPMLGQA
jgi:uncharacterized protein YfdQ (DUF2303 family)